MKKYPLLFAGVLLSITMRAQVIHIPADFPAIQQGIEAANPGDTVLVSPGTYLEIINFNGKNITVASLFLTTQDPAYISQTIIDGSQQGSVVTFTSGEDSTAVLNGFTINGGYANEGGGIYCNNSSPQFKNSVISGNTCILVGGWGYNLPGKGAGIFCSGSSPRLINLQVHNNLATGSDGGGIYLSASSPVLENVEITSNTCNREQGSYYSAYGGSGGGLVVSGSNPVLKNVDIHDNTAYTGGGMFCSGSSPVFDTLNRCNIYMNTSSTFEGNDLISDTLLHIVVDTFSVLNPSQFHASPIINFTFDILHGYHQQTASDVYVSPAGENSNSGLSAGDPVKTIRCAYSFSLADSLHPQILHLLEGTYSPSTNGELMPVTVPDYISLAGVSETEVILSAEGLNRVMNIIGNTSSHVSGMTITGGNVTGGHGGGIYCMDSDPVLENVIITGNSVYTENPGYVGPFGGFGGGFYAENSNPVLNNITITGNLADRQGGGICLQNSGYTLQNLKITGNTSGEGGGIFFTGGTSSSMENILITGNSANGSGGGMYCSGTTVLKKVTLSDNRANLGGGIFFREPGVVFDSLDRCNICMNYANYGRDLYSACNVEIVVDTFTVLNPTVLQAEPLSAFSFDILHGYHEQVDADLYVSPSGSNTNSGLTASEPLKTIFCAGTFILADSLQPHTIHLLEGTYGPSANGEIFPIRLTDYIGLAGIAETGVILDAEGVYAAVSLDFAAGNTISNVTITGTSGDGIICNYSSPAIHDLTITANQGNGISCTHSSPVISNLNIRGNQGNGIGCYQSKPVISNSLISENQGDGINCQQSDALIDYCTITENGSNGILSGWLSNPVIKNSTISGNGGNGIYCEFSSPVLQHLLIKNNSGSGINCSNSLNVNLSGGTITGNHSYRGGGIECTGSTIIFDSLERCSIYSNSASEGNDLYSDIIMNVIVDTFSVLYPTSIHASPRSNFSFDILHGMLEQVDADLFVATDGSDSNSGIAAGEPLKTVQKAITMIRADSLHQHTIHLEEGTYSSSLTGETFPVVIPAYMKLQGVSDSLVTLDAEGNYWGVVHFPNSTSAELEGVTITGGYSTGILCEGANPELKNLKVVNNPGIGVYLSNSALVLKNCMISNNGNTGLYSSNSSPFLENVKINGNTANENGGGIYCYYSQPVLKNVTISGNSTYTEWGNGGGLYCEYSSLLMDNISIISNSAYNGGGIYSDHSDHNMTNVSIEENTASQYGGGFYGVTSVLDMKNVLIAGNRADAQGAGIFNSGKGSLLKNMTITGNSAPASAYAMYWTGYPPVLENTIFWNDSIREISVYSEVHGNPPLKIKYSDVRGGQGGIYTHYIPIEWLDGSLNEDPLFTGSGEHPFMLTSGSPCRNAGTPDTTGLFLPLNDLAGGPRIWEGRVDMGAYEWNDVGYEEFRISDFGFRILNSPNPFRSLTTFYYTLDEASWVRLRIYDESGQLVAEPVNALQQEGEQKIEWNAGNLPAGIYYCRLQVGDNISSNRIIKMQ